MQCLGPAGVAQSEGGINSRPPQALATNSLQILKIDRRVPGVAKLGQGSRFREPRYSGPWCSGYCTETKAHTSSVSGPRRIDF